MVVGQYNVDLIHDAVAKGVVPELFDRGRKHYRGAHAGSRLDIEPPIDVFRSFAHIEKSATGFDAGAPCFSEYWYRNLFPDLSH